MHERGVHRNEVGRRRGGTGGRRRRGGTRSIGVRRRLGGGSCRGRLAQKLVGVVVNEARRQQNSVFHVLFGGRPRGYDAAHRSTAALVIADGQLGALFAPRDGHVRRPVRGVRRQERDRS